MRLHRLVYLLAALSALHYYLLVKADIREPLIYAGILGLLLGYRVLPRNWQRAGDRLRTARRTRSTTARA